jgi:hypothetical protein
LQITAEHGEQPWPPRDMTPAITRLYRVYKDEAEAKHLKHYSRPVFRTRLVAAMLAAGGDAPPGEADAVVAAGAPLVIFPPRPDDEKRDELRFVDAPGPLTAEHEKAETPPGMTAPLMAHQQTLLAAQLTLEDNATIRTTDQRVSQVTTSRISERFGSGKTRVAIALILARQTPPGRTTYYRHVEFNGAAPTKSPYLVRQIWPDSAVMRPNVVFMEASVVRQWLSEFEAYAPGLRVLFIENVFGLRKLKAALDNGTINDWDVVLCKNGEITGSIDIDKPERSNTLKKRKIVSVIANMMRGNVFSRVFYDDYDMAKRCKTTSSVNALWTIFVSATQSLGAAPMDVECEHTRLHDLIMNPRVDVSSTMRGSYTFGKEVNLANSGDYIEASTRIGTPEFRFYSMVNPHRHIAAMVGALVVEGEHAQEIHLALQGDAIGEAAKLAGIGADNVIDLFKKLLEGNFEAYARAKLTLDWIATINIGELEGLPEPPDGEEPYHMKHVHEHRDIDYSYPDIVGKVGRAADDCRATCTRVGKSVERVMASMKDGECIVCCEDLADTDCVILKCCGKILCGECSTRSTQLRGGHRLHQGMCPNCRQPVTIGTMIYIDPEGMKLGDVLGEGKIEEALERAELPPETKDESHDGDDGDDLIDTKELKKSAVLENIIRGRPMKHVKREVVIPGLLVGKHVLPTPTPEQRKVLIFSEYNEGLDNIEAMVKDAGFVYMRMRGGTSDLRRIANEFNTSPTTQVLLINGRMHAAGINLQTATDLVFMHKITDPAAEAQIIGRLQRIGRVTASTVHYVLYEDEDGGAPPPVAVAAAADSDSE